MTAPASNRGYITRTLLTFAGVCALAALFNLAVDPYGMFGTARVAGINAVKPAASERIRYTKPYYADRGNARTIIGGNSRPEMGLDPASPCWGEDERPVFNAAIPGAGLAQQLQFVEHTMDTGDAQLVLLGLDFMDFFVATDIEPDDTAGPSPATSPAITAGPNLRVDRQGQPARGYGRRRLRDWLTGIFSLETLGDSIATVLAQHETGSADRRADGFNPARDYWPIIRHEGQSVLFAQKNRELMRYLSRPGVGIHQGGQRWSSTFEALARFLNRARDRGIEVILFINPYHADYLTAIDRVERWSMLEAWKRTLTKLAEEHSIALWDFNALTPLTSEPPPPQGDRRTVLKWFWEPAHYRREYGETLLATMLGRECDKSGVSPTGTPLSRPMLETHLATLRLDLRRHLSASPDARRRLERAVGHH